MNRSSLKKALCALLSPTLLLACVKESEQKTLEPQEQEELHEVIFHACWDPETKTVLQEDGSVWWSPEDSIGLFAILNDNEHFISRGYVFKSTNITPTSSTDFVGYVDNDVANPYAWYAIYPCNGLKNTAGLPHLIIHIPTVQTAVAGSFDPKAFVSYAKADGDILNFRNLLGGVKFSVSQEGIKEVTFTGSNEEALTGFVMFSVEGDDLPSVFYRGGANEVTVRAPGETCFEVGKYYYAAMCPSDNESQLIITYKKESSQATYITNKATSIKRSVFKRLYDKDAGLSFAPVKDGAVMTAMMPPSYDFYSEREKVTEVYFHPSSDYTTEANLGTEEAPVYFAMEGTVVHYYTPKEYFNIKKVSSYMFSEWRSLTKIDLSGVDASEAYDFSHFFNECYNLEAIDLSHFETTSAVNMDAMFAYCKNLESLDLSSFNTSHVTNMKGMFEMCRNLRDLNLGSFDTGHCVDMSYMFNYCGSLKKLDLAKFNVSAVQNVVNMCHNMTIHRKHCFIRASDATKSLMCESDADLSQPAKDHFITWISPYDDFPAIEDPFSGLYKSTDYSKDMTFSCIQEATKGKGLDLVIMGDAYSDRLIQDGTYDQDMRNVIKHLFMEEPLKSLRDYFNLYITYVVSENEAFNGVTALDVIIEEGTTHMSGGDGIVDDYMKATLPTYGKESTMGRPLPYIIILSNAHIHAGTCTWFCEATPLIYTTLGIDDVDFHAIQCHEFGHAVGLLADEYNELSDTFSSIQEFNFKSSQGWWSNVDVTNNPNTIKWSRFLQDDRYANQGLGVFEGGLASYAYGIWRPTENSLMNTATTGFNAPCREAIYKRVHELADDTFIYDYETFVAFDQPSWANNTSTSSSIVPMNHEQTMRPLPSPVFITGTNNPNGASTTIQHY